MTARRLNIGCGPYPQAGYINIDKNPRMKPDIVRDVLRGLPFDDSSFVEVKATHFLEHVPRTELIFVLDEIWRVLVHRGLFHFVVPLEEPYSLDHLQSFCSWSFDSLVRPETPDYYQASFRWTDMEKAVLEPKGVNPHQTLDMKLRASK